MLSSLCFNVGTMVLCSSKSSGALQRLAVDWGVCRDDDVDDDDDDNEYDEYGR